MGRSNRIILQTGIRLDRRTLLTILVIRQIQLNTSGDLLKSIPNCGTIPTGPLCNLKFSLQDDIVQSNIGSNIMLTEFLSKALYHSVQPTVVKPCTKCIRMIIGRAAKSLDMTTFCSRMKIGNL